MGEPLHTEKSRLDPYHFGDTKVKIEIDLSVSLPNVVEVRDSERNSVRIKIEYPKLPPKCCNCGKFGHLLNRCPKPLMKRKPQSQSREQVRVKVAMAPPEVSVSTFSAPVEMQVPHSGQGSEAVQAAQAKSFAASPHTQRRARSRSRARARRRSLSLLPSYRDISSESEGNEGLVTEDLEVLPSNSSAEAKVLASKKKKQEDSCGVLKELVESTCAVSHEEEHIWLLPKAARRAQKRKQRVI